MEELITKRFDWFFEKHIGFGIRWDDWLYPLHLSIALPFITFLIGFGKLRESEESLPSITTQQCKCSQCGWFGTVYDCIGDIDGDGNLGCPDCSNVIEVEA